MNNPNDLALESICQSFNAFGIEVLKQVAGKEENAVFSPFSIVMALAMTWIGAKESTAAEIAQTLHLSVTPPVLANAAAAIMDAMRASDPKGTNQLHLANALWLKQGYPLLPEYLQAIRRHFKGDLFEVAFSPPEVTRKAINAWVSKQTNTKIPQLIAPGGLSAASILVLTNAIYFLGRWLHIFPIGGTKDRAFYPPTGRETKVPTMHVKDDFGYVEEADLQYLEMPYVGENLAMGIVLPKERASLPAVQGRLSATYLAELANNATEQEVDVFLPKFKLESAFDLVACLGEMGIKAAFQAKLANFGGITSDPVGMFISAVIHKAFVDVSEKGTEAAAATAILSLPACAPGGGHHEPPTFRADHPFLFLIRHTRLNAILFLGKVVLPQK